jgi:hypothetical protein
MYLDSRDIGRAQEFPNGYGQFAVSPGSYTVELRFGATAHTHTMSVGAGNGGRESSLELTPLGVRAISSPLCLA